VTASAGQLTGHGGANAPQLRGLVLASCSRNRYLAHTLKLPASYLPQLYWYSAAG